MQKEWIIGVFILLAIFMAKAFIDERRYKKKTIAKLKQEWGAIKSERISHDKRLTIDSYYQTLRDDARDVDDTTWNDLDMEETYHRLNHTESAMGEEYLYAVLRKPLFSEEVLGERNRLAVFFQENEEERIRIQYLLRMMGKIGRLSLYEYVNRTLSVHDDDSLKHVLYIVALLVSAALTIFASPLFGILLGVMFSVGIVTYYRRKAEIERYYNVLSSILRILYAMDDLVKIDVPEVEEYASRLKKASKTFRKFRRGSFLLFSGRDAGGSFSDIIMSYLHMVFHLDLIKFNSMIKEMERNRGALNEIFEVVGSLDVGMAIASYRTYLGDAYCTPELLPHSSKETLVLDATDLFHPLIEEPVTNSITETRSTLFTGSNASGKSTFLKAVAINAILSQTIYTALCTKYRANYFRVFSSMALRDDIFSKESYFIVEIKSLKRILDHMEEADWPMLCLIDEVLRGTNTLERIAASSQILRHMSTCNALCFAATHDVELTYILEDHYSNYHFTESIQDSSEEKGVGGVFFDYRLYKGRATSRNAIRLLGVMGYLPRIVDQATEEANHFMNEGKWRGV